MATWADRVDQLSMFNKQNAIAQAQNMREQQTFDYNTSQRNALNDAIQKNVLSDGSINTQGAISDFVKSGYGNTVGSTAIGNQLDINKSLGMLQGRTNYLANLFNPQGPQSLPPAGGQYSASSMQPNNPNSIPSVPPSSSTMPDNISPYNTPQNQSVPQNYSQQTIMPTNRLPSQPVLQGPYGMDWRGMALSASGDPGLEKLGQSIVDRSKPIEMRPGSYTGYQDSSGHTILTGSAPNIEQGVMPIISGGQVAGAQMIPGAAGALGSIAQSKEQGSVTGKENVGIRTQIDTDASNAMQRIAQNNRMLELLNTGQISLGPLAKQVTFTKNLYGQITGRNDLGTDPTDTQEYQKYAYKGAIQVAKSAFGGRISTKEVEMTINSMPGTNLTEKANQAMLYFDNLANNRDLTKQSLFYTQTGKGMPTENFNPWFNQNYPLNGVAAPTLNNSGNPVPNQNADIMAAQQKTGISALDSNNKKLMIPKGAQTATNPNTGQKIFSPDGNNWFDTASGKRL